MADAVLWRGNVEISQEGVSGFSCGENIDIIIKDAEGQTQDAEGQPVRKVFDWDSGVTDVRLKRYRKKSLRKPNNLNKFLRNSQMVYIKSDTPEGKLKKLLDNFEVNGEKYVFHLIAKSSDVEKNYRSLILMLQNNEAAIGNNDCLGFCVDFPPKESGNINQLLQTFTQLLNSNSAKYLEEASKAMISEKASNPIIIEDTTKVKNKSDDTSERCLFNANDYETCSDVNGENTEVTNAQLAASAVETPMAICPSNRSIIENNSGTLHHEDKVAETTGEETTDSPTSVSFVEQDDNEPAVGMISEKQVPPSVFEEHEPPPSVSIISQVDSANVGDQPPSVIIEEQEPASSLSFVNQPSYLEEPPQSVMIIGERIAKTSRDLTTPPTSEVTYAQNVNLAAMPRSSTTSPAYSSCSSTSRSSILEPSSSSKKKFTKKYDILAIVNKAKEVLKTPNVIQPTTTICAQFPVSNQQWNNPPTYNETMRNAHAGIVEQSYQQSGYAQHAHLVQPTTNSNTNLQPYVLQECQDSQSQSQWSYEEILTHTRRLFYSPNERNINVQSQPPVPQYSGQQTNVNVGGYIRGQMQSQNGVQNPVSSIRQLPSQTPRMSNVSMAPNGSLYQNSNVTPYQTSAYGENIRDARPPSYNTATVPGGAQSNQQVSARYIAPQSLVKNQVQNWSQSQYVAHQQQNRFPVQHPAVQTWSHDTQIPSDQTANLTNQAMISACQKPASSTSSLDTRSVQRAMSNIKQTCSVADWSAIVIFIESIFTSGSNNDLIQKSRTYFIQWFKIMSSTPTDLLHSKTQNQSITSDVTKFYIWSVIVGSITVDNFFKWLRDCGFEEENASMKELIEYLSAKYINKNTYVHKVTKGKGEGTVVSTAPNSSTETCPELLGLLLENLTLEPVLIRDFDKNRSNACLKELQSWLQNNVASTRIKKHLIELLEGKHGIREFVNLALILSVPKETQVDFLRKNFSHLRTGIVEGKIPLTDICPEFRKFKLVNKKHITSDITKLNAIKASQFLNKVETAIKENKDAIPLVFDLFKKNITINEYMLRDSSHKIKLSLYDTFSDFSENMKNLECAVFCNSITSYDIKKFLEACYDEEIFQEVKKSKHTPKTFEIINEKNSLNECHTQLNADEEQKSITFENLWNIKERAPVTSSPSPAIVSPSPSPANVSPSSPKASKTPSPSPANVTPSPTQATPTPSSTNVTPPPTQSTDTPSSSPTSTSLVVVSVPSVASKRTSIDGSLDTQKNNEMLKKADTLKKFLYKSFARKGSKEMEKVGGIFVDLYNGRKTLEQFINEAKLTTLQKVINPDFSFKRFMTDNWDSFHQAVSVGKIKPKELHWVFKETFIVKMATSEGESRMLNPLRAKGFLDYLQNICSSEETDFNIEELTMIENKIIDLIDGKADIKQFFLAKPWDKVNQDLKCEIRHKMMLNIDQLKIAMSDDPSCDLPTICKEEFKKIFTKEPSFTPSTLNDPNKMSSVNSLSALSDNLHPAPAVSPPAGDLGDIQLLGPCTPAPCRSVSPGVGGLRIMQPSQINSRVQDSPASLVGMFVVPQQTRLTSVVEAQSLPSVLDYKLHANLYMNVPFFQLKRRYLVIFCDNFLVFCNHAVQLPQTLGQNYKFNIERWKNDQNEEHGKILLPNKETPQNRNSSHLTSIDDYSKFEMNCLNVQSLPASSCIVSVAHFEQFYLEFGMKYKSELGIDVAKDSIYPVEAKDENPLLSMLKRISGLKKDLQYRIQITGHFNLPHNQARKYVCLIFNTHVVFIPDLGSTDQPVFSHDDDMFIKVQKYFLERVAFGSSIDSRYCRVVNSDFLKIMTEEALLHAEIIKVDRIRNFIQKGKPFSVVRGDSFQRSFLPNCYTFSNIGTQPNIPRIERKVACLATACLNLKGAKQTAILGYFQQFQKEENEEVIYVKMSDEERKIREMDMFIITRERFRKTIEEDCQRNTVLLELVHGQDMYRLVLNPHGSAVGNPMMRYISVKMKGTLLSALEAKEDVYTSVEVLDKLMKERSKKIEKLMTNWKPLFGDKIFSDFHQINKTLISSDLDTSQDSSPGRSGLSPEPVSIHRNLSVESSPQGFVLDKEGINETSSIPGTTLKESVGPSIRGRGQYSKRFPITCALNQVETVSKVSKQSVAITDIQNLQDIDSICQDKSTAENVSFMSTSNPLFPMEVSSIDLQQKDPPISDGWSPDRMLNEEPRQIIDLENADLENLLAIPGIDNDTANTIINERGGRPNLSDFVQSNAAFEVLLEDIQFDVGALRGGEIIVKYGDSDVDKYLNKPLERFREWKQNIADDEDINILDIADCEALAHYLETNKDCAENVQGMLNTITHNVRNMQDIPKNIAKMIVAFQAESANLILTVDGKGLTPLYWKEQGQELPQWMEFAGRYLELNNASKLSEKVAEALKCPNIFGREMYPDMTVAERTTALYCRQCNKTSICFENFRRSCLDTNHTKWEMDKRQGIICEEKFKAEGCGKVFDRFLTYMIHRDKDHGFPYCVFAICNVCNRKFRSPKDYLDHGCDLSPHSKIDFFKESHRMTSSNEIRSQNRRISPIEASNETSVDTRIPSTKISMETEAGRTENDKDADTNEFSLASMISQTKERTVKKPIHSKEKKIVPTIQKQHIKLDEAVPALKELTLTDSIEKLHEIATPVKEPISTIEKQSIQNNESLELPKINETLEMAQTDNASCTATKECISSIEPTDKSIPILKEASEEDLSAAQNNLDRSVIINGMEWPLRYYKEYDIGVAVFDEETREVIMTRERHSTIQIDQIDHILINCENDHYEIKEAPIDSVKYKITIGKEGVLIVDDVAYVCPFNKPGNGENIPFGNVEKKVKIQGGVKTAMGRSRPSVCPGWVKVALDGKSVKGFSRLFLDDLPQVFEFPKPEGARIIMQLSSDLKTVKINDFEFAADFNCKRTGMPLKFELGGIVHRVRVGSLPVGVVPGPRKLPPQKSTEPIMVTVYGKIEKMEPPFDTSTTVNVVTPEITLDSSMGDEVHTAPILQDQMPSLFDHSIQSDKRKELPRHESKVNPLEKTLLNVPSLNPDNQYIIPGSNSDEANNAIFSSSDSEDEQRRGKTKKKKMTSANTVEKQSQSMTERWKSMIVGGGSKSNQTANTKKVGTWGNVRTQSIVERMEEWKQPGQVGKQPDNSEKSIQQMLREMPVAEKKKNVVGVTQPDRCGNCIGCIRNKNRNNCMHCCYCKNPRTHTICKGRRCITTKIKPITKVPTMGIRDVNSENIPKIKTLKRNISASKPGPRTKRRRRTILESCSTSESGDKEQDLDDEPIVTEEVMNEDVFQSKPSVIPEKKPELRLFGIDFYKIMHCRQVVLKKLSKKYLEQYIPCYIEEKTNDVLVVADQIDEIDVIPLLEDQVYKDKSDLFKSISSKILENHYIKKKEEKRRKGFTCNLCQQWFINIKTRNLHALKYHTKSIFEIHANKTEEIPTFWCNLCKEQFSSRDARDDHIMATHVDPEDRVQPKKVTSETLVGREEVEVTLTVQYNTEDGGTSDTSRATSSIPDNVRDIDYEKSKKENTATGCSSKNASPKVAAIVPEELNPLSANIRGKEWTGEKTGALQVKIKSDPKGSLTDALIKNESNKTSMSTSILKKESPCEICGKTFKTMTAAIEHKFGRNCADGRYSLSNSNTGMENNYSDCPKRRKLSDSENEMVESSHLPNSTNLKEKKDTLYECHDCLPPKLFDRSGSLEHANLHPANIKEIKVDKGLIGDIIHRGNTTIKCEDLAYIKNREGYKVGRLIREQVLADDCLVPDQKKTKTCKISSCGYSTTECFSLMKHIKKAHLKELSLK